MNTEQLMKNMMPWLETFGLKLLTAVLLLMLGWFVAWIAGRMIRHMSHKVRYIDNTVIPMFETIVTWAIKIFFIVMVLTQLGVATTSLIAALGAAGLAIGLALQGTLQNIASGIMLIALRPIRSGESVTVVAANISGVVSEIGLFLTKIVQFDGITATIPNSVVWGSQIINFSRNPTRRMDLAVSVSYGDDLDKAISLLESIAATEPYVVQDPKPSIYVSEYRESVVIITARVWATSANYWDVHASLLKKFRQVLEGNGFQLPYPMRINHSPAKD